MDGDQVYDRQGTAYSLGSELGAGGQGKVCAIDGHAGLVIKRFHGSLLQSEDAEPLRRKVAALREKHLEQTLPEAAWPQFSVFAADGRWCGYAMRRVKGEPLLPQRFLNPVLLEKKYPQIRRPELVAIALAFLRAAAFLQEQGVKIGDYNPQNFRYHPGRRQLGFIDTDAYQVRHDGGLFVCPVTAPEMTPPELFNTPVKRRWRNPQNELFSAALLVFLILMPGKHPFDALQADDAAENLQQGGFPYRPSSGSAGPPTGRVPKGIWGRVWDDFPDNLQERFTAIFLTGHAQPHERGTLAGLIGAVAEYEAGLQQGRHLLMPLLGSPPVAPPLPLSPTKIPGAAVRITAPTPAVFSAARQTAVRCAAALSTTAGKWRAWRSRALARMREFCWRLLQILTW